MKPLQLLYPSSLIALFLFFHSSAYAQNTWAASYFLNNASSYTHSIRETSDGGFIVVGSIAVPGNSMDVWLLKLNSSGVIQWQKTYGGTDQDDGFWVEQTSDGGYVVAGQTLSFGTGPNDGWVLKLDQSGNVQWQKTFGGANSDYALFVKQTSDDGYVVAVTTRSFSLYAQYWIVRLDSSGNVVWQKLYGANGDAELSSANLTADGGFIISGMSSSFGQGFNDFLLLKLDSTGGIQWQKAYGGAETDEYATSSVQQTSDSGFILTGFSLDMQSFFIKMDVLKLNSNGQIQWQNSYGTSGSDYGYSITETTDGGYILGGQNGPPKSGAYWLLKLDSSGNIDWQKTYQGDYFQRLSSVVQTSDGGFIVSGGDITKTSYGGAWILKVNDEGEIDTSCPFITDTNVTPVPTSFSEVSTNVTVVDNSAVLPLTTVTANPGNGEYLQQCANQCVFCDSFNDGVLATDWTYSKPSWSEAGGNLIGSPVKKKALAIASPAFGGCDSCSVDTNLQSSGGPRNRVSLFTHYVDKKTNVEVTLKEEQDKVVLRQRINGVVVLKEKSAFIIDPNTFYEVILSYDGSSLSLSLNGVPLLSVPSVGPLPVGTVGFESINTTALFDDIRVD